MARHLWGSYSKYCSIQYISIATRWGNLMYGRWCLHAQWWGYFNKMKVYFITWFKLKMYKQKVELNLKKEKMPEIFRKNWRKISGNFPENFQFFRGNFPAHITSLTLWSANHLPWYHAPAVCWRHATILVAHGTRVTQLYSDSAKLFVTVTNLAMPERTLFECREVRSYTVWHASATLQFPCIRQYLHWRH